MSNSMKIDLIDYNEREFLEKRIEKIEDCLPFKKKDSITWINVNEVRDVNLIEKIGKMFNLHFLTIRNITNMGQRPKMEEFENYIFLVLNMIYLKKGKIIVEQISLVVGQNFVLSFQEREGDVFEHLREEIRTSNGKIRSFGTDYLAYALMDAIVDNYFITLENFGDRIENLQEKLVKNPSSNTLQMIHKIKREVAFLRRTVWPLREAMSRLERNESSFISKETIPYFRSLSDHVIQAVDISESMRDSLSDMLDIYLSSVSNKTNEIMKILTIFSTIFIPLTFITGIYGMNFKNMPELNWKWGYPFVLAIMGVITFLMFIFFKRKKWM